MQPALDIFRALADPTRIRIMALVRTMELAVGELAQVLGQSQPRVSRHVRILGEAGLLQRHKEGAWVLLRVNANGLPANALDAIEALLASCTEIEADALRLAQIREQRVAETRAYFDAHANGWDGIRSLHVSDDEVETAILGSLSGVPFGHVLDVGTGTGRMIELLAPRALSATGIDRSPEMLRIARGKLEAAELGRCQVRQGDMYALPQPDATIDTVIIHQVLHYAENPAAAIAEAARVLAPGGRLLIVDFAPHDHEELRTNHAHVRLGFADEVMLGWMRNAGLESAVVGHLAGGQLTVGLWLGEKRRVSERQAA